MAKFGDVIEDTQDMFNEVIRTTNLEQVLTSKVLHVEGQKDVIVVKKATPREQYLNGIDVFYLVNDEVFTGLQEVSQRYLVEEAVNSVSFDFEKERLKIVKGDVDTFNLLLRKYSLDIYESMKADISQVKEQIKEAKQE
jgi:hypothetical protein